MHAYRSRRRRPLSLAPALVIVTMLLAAVGPAAHAASPPMTDTGGPNATSSNEVNVSRLFTDVFSGENAATCLELVADGAVIGTPNGEYHGHVGMTGYVNDLRASFPDARFAITELLANGDTVVARWTMTGTQDGAFQGVAASDAPVALDGIAILHFERGKVDAASIAYDRLQVLEQIEAGADLQDGPPEVCPPCETPE